MTIRIKEHKRKLRCGVTITVRGYERKGKRVN